MALNGPFHLELLVFFMLQILVNVLKLAFNAVSLYPITDCFCYRSEVWSGVVISTLRSAWIRKTDHFLPSPLFLKPRFVPANGSVQLKNATSHLESSSALLNNAPLPSRQLQQKTESPHYVYIFQRLAFIFLFPMCCH